jgi:hypothetical protein
VAELRTRLAPAEEQLTELKAMLEDMRRDRDAWREQAQARLLSQPEELCPKNFGYAFARLGLFHPFVHVTIGFSPSAASVHSVATTIQSPNVTSEHSGLAAPGPESAPPERPTRLSRGDMRVERIDRIGLELGTEYKSRFHVEEDDPLSAVGELRQTQTMSREAWQIRIEAQMRLSCTRNAFLLLGSLRAWEGANEICHREWGRSIPRDFI